MIAYRRCLASFAYDAEEVFETKANTQQVVQNSIEVIVIGDEITEVVDSCEGGVLINNEVVNVCDRENEAGLVNEWESIQVEGEKKVEKETDCDLKYGILGLDGDGCVLSVF